MKTIFAVVLNFNGKGVIEACLRSLFASEDVLLRVVVVDNASRDNSMIRVKELFPRAHCIFNEENVGFAAGVNVGIRYALEHGADFVFLLNNDAVVEKDTLSILFRYAGQHPMAAFSPLIFSSKEKKRIWFCGGEIDWCRMRAQHRACEKLPEAPFLSEYLSGCAFFAPKRAFYDVGLFDDEYFLYYEDADWGVRAGQAGYALWVVPAAHAVHAEQSETENPKKLYFLVLSGVLFFLKNTTGWRYFWYRLFFFLRRCKNWGDRYFHWGDPRVVGQVYNAYRDAKYTLSLHHHCSVWKRDTSL